MKLLQHFVKVCAAPEQ